MQRPYSDSCTAPVLEQLETLALQHLHGVLPGSLLGKASHDFTAQWPKLVRYVDNGRGRVKTKLKCLSTEQRPSKTAQERRSLCEEAFDDPQFFLLATFSHGLGRYPIDNNDCENAIRPFCVGRRNWWFTDTVGGANASANLYSLLQPCKANGNDGYQYLTELLNELPKAKTVEDFEALRPWRLVRADR